MSLEAHELVVFVICLQLEFKTCIIAQHSHYAMQCNEYHGSRPKASSPTNLKIKMHETQIDCNEIILHISNQTTDSRHFHTWAGYIGLRAEEDRLSPSVICLL